MSHPTLTPAQAERLEMLIEECAEIIQAATKTLRHGYASHHPDTMEQNAFQMRRELTDLDAVRYGMSQAGDPCGGFFTEYSAQETWRKKLRWTHTQAENLGVEK